MLCTESDIHALSAFGCGEDDIHVTVTAVRLQFIGCVLSKNTGIASDPFGGNHFILLVAVVINIYNSVFSDIVITDCAVVDAAVIFNIYLFAVFIVEMSKNVCVFICKRTCEVI